MDAARWTAWADRLAGVGNDHELANVLEQIAAEVRENGIAADWSRVGVAVRRRSLTGRLGGIVQHAGRKVVLVSDQIPPQKSAFVTAHEVGHLLLSSALGVVGDEERLCDSFAHAVTGGNQQT